MLAGKAIMAERKSIVSKMALQFPNIFTLNPSPLMDIPLATTSIPIALRIPAAWDAITVVKGVEKSFSTGLWDRRIEKPTSNTRKSRQNLVIGCFRERKGRTFSFKEGLSALPNFSRRLWALVFFCIIFIL
jgi:hypothetical protein